MPSNEHIEEVVSRFLESRTGLQSIPSDLDLFDSGLVNSLFALDLLAFVETRFGVRATAADLDLSRFATVAGIAGFVAEKQGAGG